MIRAARKMMGMDLPSKIDYLLEGRSWTRRELARRIKRPQQTVQNWCNGKEPKRVDLLKLARALDVPVEYLMDDAQDQPPAPLVDADEWALLHAIRASGRKPLAILGDLLKLSQPPTITARNADGIVVDPPRPDGGQGQGGNRRSG